ncbi:hypothetical protein ACI780_18020 [Geodermatophilus sp. SYSU D00814]
MDGEIQLISDGDGLAVIGDRAAVERFLISEKLAYGSRELPKLGSVLSRGAALADAGSKVAEASGRWVKLTKQSADLIAKHGLTPTKTPGVSHAMVGEPGSIKSWLQVAQGPGSKAANPALLSGAAGIMTQLAMQQAMDQITDYLATIDEKLDDVLRAQEDAVVAVMIGVGFDIDEALTIREHGGRVNEVTWSKVQAAPATIARTQAYALRQLDALAEKVECKAKIGDLAKATKDVETKVQTWLAVLARCFQLLDAVAVIELDRVLEVAPDDLDGHRLGLRAVRQKRLDTISQSIERLLSRMTAAAVTANLKVLFNPVASPAVVQSSERVVTALVDLHGRLGIEFGRESLEARAWTDAAAELRDRVLETGADGIDASKRLGSETLDRARSVTGRISSGIAARTSRWRADDEGRDGEVE